MCITHQPSVSCQKAFFQCHWKVTKPQFLFNRLFISVCKDNVTHPRQSSRVLLTHQHDETTITCWFNQMSSLLFAQMRREKNTNLVSSEPLERYSVFSSDLYSLKSISSKISHYKSSRPHNLIAKISLWPRLYFFFMFSISLPTLHP